MRTAPELHPNFFLACLQLIFWVFFKPVTLRDYTGTLIPGFDKDFSLWSARKQLNPRLNRFLTLQFAAIVIGPCLISFPIILLSKLAATGEISLFNAVLAVAFGIAVGVVSGAIINIVSGIFGAVMIGIVCGLMFAFTGDTMPPITDVLRFVLSNF